MDSMTYPDSLAWSGIPDVRLSFSCSSHVQGGLLQFLPTSTNQPYASYAKSALGVNKCVPFDVQSLFPSLVQYSQDNEYK